MLSRVQGQGPGPENPALLSSPAAFSFRIHTVTVTSSSQEGAQCPATQPPRSPVLPESKGGLGCSRTACSGLGTWQLAAAPAAAVCGMSGFRQQDTKAGGRKPCGPPLQGQPSGQRWGLQGRTVTPVALAVHRPVCGGCCTHGALGVHSCLPSPLPQVWPGGQGRARDRGLCR